MSSRKRSLCFICAFGLIVALAGTLSPLQVIRHPAPSGPLAGRLDWALQEAAKIGSGKGFWIGFGIRRLMGEHSQIGMNVRFTSEAPSLDELIYGRRSAVERKISSEQEIKDAARHALDPAAPGGRERKVLKEIAILMKFTAAATRKPQSVSISSLSFGVSLEDLPLFWLGPASDDDSIRLLESFYGPAASEELRSSLVEAVALHRKADRVVPFLERVLSGREPEKLRAEAAEFLGDQDDVRALDILRRTVRTDVSLEVRKGAVSGLTEMSLPAAADVLIDLALNGCEAEVRDEAIQGLAEKATKATIATLEQLATTDKDAEIQKQAVSALADLPAKGGLPYLIKIAKTHPVRDVRIEAIEALGDFHDPAAVKALVEIIKNAK
ncbi:MAG: HEAT repeat domain-containing protein [Candidatus Aminicenantales bacterium]